eukprot:2771849-Amphidinium_carterae.1
MPRIVVWWEPNPHHKRRSQGINSRPFGAPPITQNHSEWQEGYRLLKTALISFDAVTPVQLQ